MPMTDGNIIQSLTQIEVIQLVKEYPGKGEFWYAIRTNDDEIGSKLDRAVIEGKIIKERNSPIIGGWIYKPAI